MTVGIEPPNLKAIGRQNLKFFRISGDPLDRNRVVRLSAGVLALTGASDDDAIGFTSKYAQSNGQWVQLKNTDSREVFIEAVDSSISMGDVVYQAAEGKVDDTGTVRVGVALSDVKAWGHVLVVPD